jgi:hypothetical protein
MSTKQICYHGWSFETLDRRILLPHVSEGKHHCGLPPGHAGPCVCRECGANPVSPADLLPPPLA